MINNAESHTSVLPLLPTWPGSPSHIHLATCYTYKQHTMVITCCGLGRKTVEPAWVALFH